MLLLVVLMTHDMRHRVQNNLLAIQWNLGIRDTQGTVQNCPEF